MGGPTLAPASDVKAGSTLGGLNVPATCPRLLLRPTIRIPNADEPVHFESLVAAVAALMTPAAAFLALAKFLDAALGDPTVPLI